MMVDVGRKWGGRGEEGEKEGRKTLIKLGF